MAPYPGTVAAFASEWVAGFARNPQWVAPQPSASASSVSARPKPEAPPPTALFPDKWLARLAAAVLPGTGQDPMLLLQKDEAPEGGYPVALEAGDLVGLFQYFDEKLVDAMNVAIHLLTSLQALAYLLPRAPDLLSFC